MELMANYTDLTSNEIFLSYSSQDNRFASRLLREIRKNGISVWDYQTSQSGSEIWHDEIGKAISRCDWFLVILSENSVCNRMVKEECLYALTMDKYLNRTIPIMYKRCNIEELSWMLKKYNPIDFTKDFSCGCRKLFKILGRKYNTGKPTKNEILNQVQDD